MQLITGYLAPDLLLDEMDAFVQLLHDLKISTVFVSFGFGCSVDDRLQTQDIPVATDDLIGFIEDQERAGAYSLGDDNLTIRSGARGLRLLLCHEHDIHFSSSDPRVVRRVRSRWASLYPRSYAHHGEGRVTRLHGPFRRKVRRNP
jgi:hypothetical protein